MKGSSKTCWPAWEASTSFCLLLQPMNLLSHKRENISTSVCCWASGKASSYSRRRILLTRTLVELVRLEADEFVRGSFLEGARLWQSAPPPARVWTNCAPRSRNWRLPIAEKDSSRYFRLPIDRAFSMRGFGAVVTGTLISGSVRLEQEVELFPSGRRVRVRGIQVHCDERGAGHGGTTNRVEPGRRGGLRSWRAE